MQIDHGRGDIGMAQQLFKGYNIDPLFEQVCGISMAERMQVYLFFDGCFFSGFRASPTKDPLRCNALRGLSH